MEVNRLILTAVESRLDRGLRLQAAVGGAAEALGMTVDRILRTYLGATNPEQERGLDFLSLDHGSFRLATPLASHPICERLKLGREDLLAHFDDGNIWVLFSNGIYALAGFERHIPSD